MTAREYLEQIGVIKKKIYFLELEADEYERLSLSVPGPNYDRPIVDGTRSLEAPFVKWIDKKFETLEKIEKLKKKLTVIEKVSSEAISELEDAEYRLILTYKYFDGLSWIDIAEKVHYSRQTVYRYCQIALDLIKIPNL